MLPEDWLRELEELFHGHSIVFKMKQLLATPRNDTLCLPSRGKYVLQKSGGGAEGEKK